MFLTTCTELVNAIFDKFVIRPQWLSAGGAFYAPCNQTAPAFGIKIGTKSYFMNPGDIMRQNQRDRETGTLCRVGLYDSGVGPYNLGVTFLTNVVAVFDVENSEMRFASREKY